MKMIIAHPTMMVRRVRTVRRLFFHTFRQPRVISMEEIFIITILMRSGANVKVFTFASPVTPCGN